MTKPYLNWGILSTAKIGVEHVIPAILKSTNGSAVAIASRDMDKAKSVARRFQIPKTYGSYEALLADPEIDAVYIPTITSNHTEWSLKAIEAGKAVLCEKPMAMQAEDIETIEVAAKDKGVLVGEAYMVAHHPQWQKVRDLLAEGAIGDLQHVDAAFTYFNVDPNNMRNVKDQGGGGLRDIGVYPVVTTLFATGAKVKNVSAYVRYDKEFEVDVYADGHVQFAEGFDLRFYVSTQLANRQKVIYHGSEGTIEVSVPFNANIFGEPQVILTNQKGDVLQTHRFPAIDQYKLQVESFADAALNGSAFPVSPDLSYEVQRIIDACFESGGGKIVKL